MPRIEKGRPGTKPSFNKPRPGGDDGIITIQPVRPGRPSRPKPGRQDGNNGNYRDTQPNTSTPATPDLPTQAPTITGPTKQPVKPASPDIILFNDDLVPIEVMTDLLFEEIGGQELINISRNDTINGQNLVYRPIRNLTQLATRYGPQNILALQNTSNSFFNNFPIKLEERLPIDGNGPGGTTVYFESVPATATAPATTNLVIEVVNMEEDERVEVQILTNANVLNDTIYIQTTEEES